MIRLAPGSKEKRSRSSDPRPRPRSMFSPGPPQGDTKPWYMREPRDSPSIGMMTILNSYKENNFTIFYQKPHIEVDGKLNFSSSKPNRQWYWG